MRIIQVLEKSENSTTNKFQLEETECPVCSMIDHKMIFIGRDRLYKKEGRFSVVQCRKCRMVYTNPRPTVASIGYFYPSDYAPYLSFFKPSVEIFNDREGFRFRIKNELKKQVLEYYYGYKGLLAINGYENLAKLPGILKKPMFFLSFLYFKKTYPRIPFWKKSGKAVDIGCANGSYLLLLKNLGWEVMGVDIEDNTADEIRAVDIPVFEGDLNTIDLENKSFDLITMWHVLEHLHNPATILKQIHGLLKDKGSLVIEVPNSSSLVRKIFGSCWFPWDLPRHLNHFSGDSLCKILNQCGFRILEIKHLPRNTMMESLGYWLEDHLSKRVDKYIRTNFIFSNLLKLFNFFFSVCKFSDVLHVKAGKNKS